MDSPGPVVSPLKKAEKQYNNVLASLEKKDLFGAVDVYIHQARDIHNICIYQKQDVYAKLCVTSDPHKTVSTKIINGGGANPVFNESLSLHVAKVDSSLKCEIWMLSRVRNYLEDQLLGFTLVPISEILLHNGKLEKEFSLSSTDLFHSPAGFVHLSVSYNGTTPEVILIPSPPRTSVESVPEDMDRIEFPDPKVVNENNQMVEEYFGMPMDSQSSDSLLSSDTENQDVQLGENFIIGTGSPRQSPKMDSPPSTNGISSASARVSFQSSETPKSPSEELVSPPKETANGVEAESNASVKLEPEPKVVQQDIVDMYMKSMQQFTESLAKMKLPDFENGPTSSENSTNSEQKTPSSRVFYGSRAFF